MTERPTSDKLERRIYSDFTTNMQPNPVTGELGVVVNEASVKQSIRNIVLTNKTERIYKMDLGADLYKLLFENLTDETALLAEAQVRTALKTYEPRIDVISVNVIFPDSRGVRGTQGNLLPKFEYVDQNVLIINVVYRIINTSQQDTIQVAVERLR